MASTQITPLCLFMYLSGLEAWAQAPIASLESTSDQAEER